MLVVTESSIGGRIIMKIGIDPGHGGEDPGAMGAYGTREKDVNLAIAQRVEFLLKRMGIETVMTRTDDSSKSLMTRSNLLNGAKVDYVISIHCNSSNNPRPNYISTFVQASGGEAEQLAEKVQARMVQTTGWPDGGVRVQNLHMTRETMMPAVLCECGFISNPAQEVILKSSEGQARLARSIVDGLNDFVDRPVENPVVEQWKINIMDRAAQNGLVTSPHEPDDAASKWFVLQVALNLLDAVGKRR